MADTGRAEAAGGDAMRVRFETGEVVVLRFTEAKELLPEVAIGAGEKLGF